VNLGEQLRILIVEDSPDDAELMKLVLRQSGLEVLCHVADDPASLLEALIDVRPHLVISDYSLPGFSGAAVVRMVRGWDEKVPCILVSGMVGEELAVTAVRAGATDYVLKERLEVLPAAVRRALAEAAGHTERRRLESELDQFREVAYETFRQMPLGFAAVDPVGRIAYVNPAARALLGRNDPVSDIGMEATAFLPPTLGAAMAEVRSADLTGTTVEALVPLDGSTWVEAIACRTSAGTALFLRDVTDRTRAEAEVEASHTMMIASLDAIPDAFVLCSAVRDGEGRVVDFRLDLGNRSAMSAFGGAEEPRGRRMRELMPGPSHDAIFAAGCRVMESGAPWVDEALVVGSPPVTGGGPLIINLQVVPFADGIIATWRDVTESVSLRRDRERLAAAMEQTSDGVLISDANGSVTYANAAFLEASHLDAAQVVGRPAIDVIPQGIPPTDVIASATASALALRPWLGEIEQVLPDGPPRRLEVSLTPVREADGSVSAYAMITRDVTRLRAAETEVALEARVRAAVAEGLTHIPVGATLAQSAQAICDALITLPSIDQASIDVFLSPSELQVIGIAAPPGFPVSSGDSVPPERATIIHEKLLRGPWAWYPNTDPTRGRWVRSLVAAGIKATSYIPILRGAELVGTLVLGTFDAAFAHTLVDTMPGLMGLSAASSALLAERLHAIRDAASRRAALADAIAERAFSVVFQPIVDLATRERVGFEALTRFDSGARPDLVFANAWELGLGAALEAASLEAALLGAHLLPSGRWLDLNASPRFLADGGHIRGMLAAAGRPVVVEVTEHEVIQDYETLRDAVRGRGPDVRLAVDDAGAGVANFGHSVELRPDFIKLDRTLVSGVNFNLGRQAIVVGLRHFARTAGCRLVAEGIETEEEAQTLLELGVEFGQGFLFGRPEPAELLSTKPRRTLTTISKTDGRRDPHALRDIDVVAARS
jgi:PAS domain S-box-containing protein